MFVLSMKNIIEVCQGLFHLGSIFKNCNKICCGIFVHCIKIYCGIFVHHVKTYYCDWFKKKS